MLEIAADLRGWQKWESLWEPIDDDLYLKRRRAATAAHDFHNVHFDGGIFRARKKCTKMTLRCWFQLTDYRYQFIL